MSEQEPVDQALFVVTAEGVWGYVTGCMTGCIAGHLYIHLFGVLFILHTAVKAEGSYRFRAFCISLAFDVDRLVSALFMIFVLI